MTPQCESPLKDVDIGVVVESHWATRDLYPIVPGWCTFHSSRFSDEGIPLASVGVLIMIRGQFVHTIDHSRCLFVRVYVG